MEKYVVNGQIEEQIMAADRMAELANSFEPFSSVTPTGEEESLDDIRMPDGTQKFFGITFTDVAEKDTIASTPFNLNGRNYRIHTIGIQKYSGAVSGSVLHPETHEGVFLESNTLYIQQQINGDTLPWKAWTGPIPFNQIKDVHLIFGKSKIGGVEIPVLKMELGGQVYYQLADIIEDGMHQAVKPSEQEEPSVSLIFKMSPFREEG